MDTRRAAKAVVLGARVAGKVSESKGRGRRWCELGELGELGEWLRRTVSPPSTCRCVRWRERWLVRGSSMMNWMNSWESGEASALVQVREMRRWEVGVAGVVDRRASQSWVESLVCGLDGWELG
jgi:hypothetical protein